MSYKVLLVDWLVVISWLPNNGLGLKVIVANINIYGNMSIALQLNKKQNYDFLRHLIAIMYVCHLLLPKKWVHNLKYFMLSVVYPHICTNLVVNTQVEKL